MFLGLEASNVKNITYIHTHTYGTMQEIKKLVLALECRIFYISFYYHKVSLYISKTVGSKTGCKQMAVKSSLSRMALLKYFFYR
jgi:hypothetical protein